MVDLCAMFKKNKLQYGGGGMVKSRKHPTTKSNSFQHSICKISISWFISFRFTLW